MENSYQCFPLGSNRNEGQLIFPGVEGGGPPIQFTSDDIAFPQSSFFKSIEFLQLILDMAPKKNVQSVNNLYFL